MNIVETLEKLGFTEGYAANHATGIILWLNKEPEPTKQELLDAGWTPEAEPVDE